MELSLYFFCDFYIFLRKSLATEEKKRFSWIFFEFHSCFSTNLGLPMSDLLLSEKQKKKIISFIWAPVKGSLEKKKNAIFTRNSLVLICKPGLNAFSFCGFYITHHLFLLAFLSSLTAKSGQMPFKILSFTINAHHNTYHSALSFVIVTWIIFLSTLHISSLIENI